MPSEPIDAPVVDHSGTDSPAGSPPPDNAAGEMSSPVAARVYELLAPVVATAGVELLDVEWTGGTLRVVLDHPEGVTTDSLTAVNRLVSPILDQHDPVPGRYTLEVSSPGVERPLRRLEHYRRAIGENIIVKTVPGMDPRRVKGLLRSADEAQLTVEAAQVDGVDLADAETMTIAMTDIAGSRTVFDWGPTPKPGTVKPGQKTKAAKPHGPAKPYDSDQKQSRRKTKKASGNASSKKQSGKRQPNTAEQERGRP